jgi:hypothetical protein
MEVISVDYVEYANLGSYLFSTVRKRFFDQGFLYAFDFFSIVIWKSNRSKSNIAKRLSSKGTVPLEESVKDLTQKIHQAQTAKEKLQILREHHFRMPMASAILTVLYPDDFTVYDFRVREALGIPKINFPWRNYELVWSRYQEFKNQVVRGTPSVLSLREKDLYLWGKSRADQLIDDIKNGFPPRKKKHEEDEEDSEG